MLQGVSLSIWGPPKHISQVTGDPRVLAVVQTRGISLECVSMLQSVDGCRAFPDVQVVFFSLAVLAGFFPS